MVVWEIRDFLYCCYLLYKKFEFKLSGTLDIHCMPVSSFRSIRCMTRNVCTPPWIVRLPLALDLIDPFHKQQVLERCCKDSETGQVLHLDCSIPEVTPLRINITSKKIWMFNFGTNFGQKCPTVCWNKTNVNLHLDWKHVTNDNFTAPSRFYRYTYGKETKILWSCCVSLYHLEFSP